MNKKIIKYALLVLSLFPLLSHAWCTEDSALSPGQMADATANPSQNIDPVNVTPEENAVGSIIQRTWQSNDWYDAHYCNCNQAISLNSTSIKPNSINAPNRIANSITVTPDGPVDGLNGLGFGYYWAKFIDGLPTEEYQGKTWAIINDYVAVTVTIKVNGAKDAWYDVPFDNKSNLASQTCQRSGNDFRTGGTGNIFYRIRKPFIGPMVFDVPIVNMYNVHGNHGGNLNWARPLLVVHAKGNIISPQSCKFVTDSNVGPEKIDFGEVSNSFIRQANVGEAIHSVPVKTLHVSYTCTGTDSSMSVALQMTGISSNGGTAIQTSNKYLSIKTTVDNKVVTVNKPSTATLDNMATDTKSFNAEFRLIKSDQANNSSDALPVGGFNAEASLDVVFQ